MEGGEGGELNAEGGTGWGGGGGGIEAKRMGEWRA